MKMSPFYAEGDNELTKKEIHGTIGCALKAKSGSRPSLVLGATVIKGLPFPTLHSSIFLFR